MRVLLDTNVILDFFLERTPHAEAADRLFQLAHQGKLEAYTTASSITDIYYIVARALGNNAARNVLQNLFNLLTVIAVDGDDCIHAMGLPISDYEDAVVVTCSLKDNIDFIVTNDTKFLSADPTLIRVVTPNNFLSLHF